MPRILVVDDDRELRENMAEILAGSGFDVVVAENGEKAITSLEGASFDLVLLDLIMPGMGGMEALARLKKSHPAVSVVMITAFATVENAVEAMRRGADDYISKPFRVSDLLATVRRVLEEVRFRQCRLQLDMETTFNCLANSLRREILIAVQRQGRIRFMDIVRELAVDDHTKINFHLKILRDAGLIRQDEKKNYELTPEGAQLIDCLNYLAKNLTA